MLEDELNQLWGKESYILKAGATWARLDYNYAYYAPRASHTCHCTAILIREHLLEALSSPNAYIREWGKLIAKEQDG